MSLSMALCLFLLLEKGQRRPLFHLFSLFPNTNFTEIWRISVGFELGLLKQKANTLTTSPPLWPQIILFFSLDNLFLNLLLFRFLQTGNNCSIKMARKRFEPASSESETAGLSTVPQLHVAYVIFALGNQGQS